MGKKKYQNATQLTITADAGGSNSYRNRGWRFNLQALANKTGLKINVHHYPPGTSKWNKIEHRLFSYISKNWRGRPLVDLKTVVSLIANTTTNAGLWIKSVIDKVFYEKGKKYTDEEMKSISLIEAEFQGKWNYTILPNEGHSA